MDHMQRTTDTKESRRDPVHTVRRSLSAAYAGSLFALMLILFTFVQAPVAYAQDGVPRDTRTWIDPSDGPNFTFSTVEIRNDCEAIEDTIYTIGMRPGWTLQGTIVVRLPADPNPANAFTIINVNQTSSELNVRFPIRLSPNGRTTATTVKFTWTSPLRCATKRASPSIGLAAIR